MRLNTLFIISCLTICLYSFGQNNVLPTPDKSFFDNKLSDTGNVVHNYLVSYFEKTEAKKYIDNNYGWDCKWTEVFNSKIIYKEFICHETGYNITVIFHGYSYEEVLRICKAILTYSDHKWYSENKYGPLDNDPGCRVTIEMKDDVPILNYYCGC
ncbi:MAG: hypothetical protein K0B10_12015 [Vicingaceae bacterium]|nr:hypothetical protein [Vicingaceae bacterium]